MSNGSRPVVVATDSGWALPLAGRSVSGLIIDDAVTLRCVSAEGTAFLELDGPFEVRAASGDRAEVVPDAGPDGLAGALDLLFRTVDDASVRADGHLCVSFADGGALHLAAEELFQSWRLYDDVGTLMVSMPENYAAIDPHER